MKATLNILLMILLGLSLSFCSSTPKDTEEKAPEASSDGYDSSSTYDDINSAAGDEEASTGADYGSDDSYGSTGDTDSGSSDDSYMGGTEDDSSSSVANDPLPVETIEEDSTPVVDTPSSSGGSGFKDGFYVISKNCNMRADASAKSANEGKVKAGKRLWVESHNSNWVKVFKKSGPVYLSKSCL